jgi:signal peptidase I
MIERTSSTASHGLYAIPGGIYSLSGTALKELAAAATDQRASLRFKALGSSMSPFIRNGDIVTISPVGGRRLRGGIIVAFCHPKTNKLVVHRIVRVAPGGVWPRGDNTTVPDGFVPFKNILGIVSQVRRRQRRILLGNGPEGAILAALSRKNMLRPMTFTAWRILRPFRFLRKPLP